MTKKNHNALQTLWGSGDPERDRKRKNTAKSMISPSEGGVERPQEIYTPQVILDVIAEVWPEGITLDPCSGPESIVPARIRYDGSPGKDGLEEVWYDFTYFNPPYKDLKKWMAKAVAESPANNVEIIGLFPVRPHRVWWRRTAVKAAALSCLDPLCFRGYKQAFPAPLCLMYWGSRVEKFYEACKKVSKP
jgi:hypothetical protein